MNNKKPSKPKRMFALIEFDSTITAKELAEQLDQLAFSGAVVLQTHVNVAKAPKKPAEPAGD